MVKKCLLLCIGILFACLHPLEVHADAMPDVIRYEELETLVKAYSPQIQMEQAQYDSRLARYENAREEIMETRRLLREEAEDLEKDGDKDSASQYRAQAKTLEDAAKDMDKQIRSAQGSQASMSLRRMEDTVLWTAQNLMGTYNTLKAEQGAALAQAEWKQSHYEKLLRQVQTGSASAAQADQAGSRCGCCQGKGCPGRDGTGEEGITHSHRISGRLPDRNRSHARTPAGACPGDGRQHRQMARTGKQLFPEGTEERGSQLQ